jgi:hypothetical protein
LGVAAERRVVAVVVAATRANAGVVRKPITKRAVGLAVRLAALRVVPPKSVLAKPVNRGDPKGFLVAGGLASRGIRAAPEVLVSKRNRMHQVSNASPENPERPRVYANDSRELESSFGNGKNRASERSERVEIKLEIGSKGKTRRIEIEQMS